MTDSAATPLKPSFDEFRDQCRRGNVLCVYTELSADYETPLSVYRKIAHEGGAFLFESAERMDRLGRYSFLGSRPGAVLEARGGEVTVTDPGGGRLRKDVADPLRALEEWMEQYRPVVPEELPAFCGGAVGYVGYDAVRAFEPTVHAPPPDDLDLPDLLFMITESLVIFDHRFRRIWVVANVFRERYDDDGDAYKAGRDLVEELVSKIGAPLCMRPMNALMQSARLDSRSNTTREEYMRMVETAKEFIRAGDIFQVVPSQRFQVEFTGDPADLYRALRHINPSPYMFCLEFAAGFSLVGSSPEVHVRAMDGEIQIRPIAGTRPRGLTDEEDARLADDLLGDPKERAEHIMLVDLARNDVGRIARFKSVEVTDFMMVEYYSHVMHIVSNVVGQLEEGRTAYDVMRATFPAGTVSGSPKVRAMQIVNDLEKNKRCSYAGAVGYFGFDGNLDSCIALRTVVLKGGSAFVQAGAGIVADSDPATEYQETVNKAMGMIRAIELAVALEARPEPATPPDAS